MSEELESTTIERILSEDALIEEYLKTQKLPLRSKKQIALHIHNFLEYIAISYNKSLQENFQKVKC